MRKRTEMEEKAIAVVRHLQQNGYEAVFAGGYVRDKIMGVEPHDIDIATNATPDQVESLFEKTIPVGKSFGVVRVVYKEEEFEVATFRTDGEYIDGRRPESVEFATMEEDAKRRDFTIGGMFFDPITKEVMDFVGGQEDIKAGIIRFIGDPYKRIEEDKLRILRGVRFAVRFGFKMAPETLDAIIKRHKDVASVSPERIKEELIKLLGLKKPRQVIEFLINTGIMDVILPEVSRLSEVPQPPEFHPEGDTLEHTILVLEELVNEPIELQLAGLFHDIGKADTLVIRGDKIRSPLHAKVGAKITREILKRLKFSNKEIEYIGELVYSHMKMIHFHQMRKASQKKFFSRDDFEALKTIHLADRGGRGLTTEENNGDRIDPVSTLERIDAIIEKLSKEEMKPKPFVDGRDLINLGLKEGHLIGRIKEELYDSQLENFFLNREEALEYAKKRIKSMS